MSNELLKQLKIKSAMLRRLKKEYESYDKETKNINCKIEEVEAKNKQEPNEQYDILIRKNRQFLGESESVLSNVKQKLIEAFEGLATFLSEKGNDQSLSGSEQKNNAQELVLDVETFLENLL